MKLYKRLFVIAPLLLSAACGEVTPSKRETPRQYDWMMVKKSDIQVERSFPALIKGRQDIRVIPRVEGYLREILVNEGDHVKKGQKLFVIEQTAYQAEVRNAKAGVSQAEALLGKAKQDYEGKRRLREKSIVSEFDLEQTKRDAEIALSNLEAAKAQLEIANNNLSFTELKSPCDGIIGAIPFKQGDLVGPNTQQGLCIVSDNQYMNIYFSISETSIMEYLTTYHSMQEAINQMPPLSLQLSNGKIYGKEGKIKGISGVVDERTGSVSVRATFPNEEGTLLSGSSARVLMKELFTDVLMIPQKATFEILDKTYVYKVVGGKACSCIITIEQINDGDSYIVTSGLKEGDTIITQGTSFIQEGEQVK